MSNRSHRSHHRRSSLNQHLPQAVGLSAPPKSRRTLWLLVGSLTLALLAGKLLLDYVSSTTNQRLLQQALDIIEHDPATAEEILQLSKDDSSSNFLAALTESQVRQKHWPEAESTAQRWIQAQPDNSNPWLALAEILQQQNKVIPASSSLSQAVKLAETAKQRDAIRSKLFPMLLLIDDSVAAQELLKNLETDNARQELLSSLSYAHLLRVNGDWERAIELATRHVQSDPQPAPALMLRGIIELERKNFSSAQADLLQVIQQQPTNKEAHYKLAIALRELNQLEEAQKHFTISQQLANQRQSQTHP